MEGGALRKWGWKGGVGEAGVGVGLEGLKQVLITELPVSLF